MNIYSKNIVTPEGIKEGYLVIEEGKIKSIVTHCDGQFINHEDKIILPGFIDIHLHGWATGSFWMEKTAEAIEEMAKNLPRVGVTSFLASTGADSIENTNRYILEANKVFERKDLGAEFLGVHMEGPFINKEFKGMQKEEHCIQPDIKLMKSFYDLQENSSMIKLMTIAPELEGAKDVLKFCKEKNITCAIGHSSATFDCIKDMKQYGLYGVTHMFSGMKGFHHRELGVAGSALYFDDLSCEFAKQTGKTVKHEAFDLVYRLKGSDRIYLTTDCCGYAQVKEPFYHYIRKEMFEPECDKLKITSDSGEVRYINPKNYDEVKDIELSYIDSVKNMVEHTPMSWVDVAKITSLNPAKYIHCEDRKGSLEVGKDADIIVLDDAFNLISVYCGGDLKNSSR